MPNTKDGRDMSGNTDANHILQGLCPKQYKNLRGLGICTYPSCEKCTLVKPKEKQHDNPDRNRCADTPRNAGG